jgi:MFS family permease
MSTNRTDSMEAARPRGVGRVLWHRNFFPYFAGNMLSNSGTWFQAIAQVLLVYRLTGSEFLVGLVNFSQFAAVLVLAPVAGPAADRFDRRRVIVVTQVAAVLLATTLALLTAADRATAPVVIAVALALGATTAMATPALQAFVPGLVSRSELPAAMALTAVTFNLARALGPVLGVLVIEQWGLATAFAVNALSYVGLIVGIRMVDSHAGQEKPAERPNLRTSVALAARNPVLFLPLAAVGLVSISADPVKQIRSQAFWSGPSGPEP